MAISGKNLVGTLDNPNANNKKLESALDYSIRMLESGSTIEDCLRLYPNQRKELKGLLEAAVCIKESYPGYPELRPSKLYMKTGKAKFLAAIEDGVPASIQEPRKTQEDITPALFNIYSLFRRAYVTSAAAAAAIVVLSGGLMHMASGSLPGDPLYAVKRATESAQLAMTLDSKAKAQLHYDFAQRRINEANKIAKAGEKSAAFDIVKDAEDSLKEAEKIAKATPSGTKVELEGEIKTLGNKIKEQATTLAMDSKMPAGDEASQTPAADGVTDMKVALDKTANTNSANGSVDASAPGSKEDAVAGTSEGQRNNIAASVSLAKDRRSIASMRPFEVAGLSVSDENISPNSDGIKDKLIISVTGANEADYSVVLFRGAVKIATIANQSSGKDLELAWDGTDINSKVVPDGKYSLRVVNGIGQIAHTKAKVIVDTAGDRANLVEPADGISTDKGQLRFVWGEVDGAETYTLCIRSKDSESDDIEVSGLTTNAFQLDRALLPGDWKWRVIIKDRAGNTGYSTFGHFTIEVNDNAESTGDYQVPES